MTSKPNKNMDSIGHGLLNDKQKYRKEETDAIEMKDRSKKYNYVNLDDQDEHVVTMTKPSQQQPPRLMESTDAINYNMPPGANQQKTNAQTIQKTNPHKPDNSNYPNIDYNPLPANGNLPVYGSNTGMLNNRQPDWSSQQYQSQYQPQYYPQQPYQYQYQPRNNYALNYPRNYRQQSFFGYSQPQYYGDNPYVRIPGISHGELRPVPTSIHSSQMMGNGSRISLNGMQFNNNPPNNNVNTSTLGPQKKPADDKPVVPDMLTTCKFCMSPQNIPGDSTLYACYNCQRRVKCFPTHNIFKCTSCEKQFCYQLGTSHRVKCGYCKTVNQVPVSHEESLNISMNASRIEASRIEASRIQAEPIIELEPEKKPQPPKIFKKKEVQAKPLLKPEQTQYPVFNSEDGFDELSEVINQKKPEGKLKPEAVNESFGDES